METLSEKRARMKRELAVKLSEYSDDDLKFMAREAGIKLFTVKRENMIQNISEMAVSRRLKGDVFFSNLE